MIGLGLVRFYWGLLYLTGISQLCLLYLLVRFTCFPFYYYGIIHDFFDYQLKIRR